MWQQLQWSAFWLPLATADPGEYICPSTYERASFCLASSVWLQCTVIAAYVHLLLAAQRLCCGFTRSECKEQQKLEEEEEDEKEKEKEMHLVAIKR